MIEQRGWPLWALDRFLCWFSGSKQEATVEAEQVDVGPRFARPVLRLGGGCSPLVLPFLLV